MHRIIVVEILKFKIHNLIPVLYEFIGPVFSLWMFFRRYSGREKKSRHFWQGSTGVFHTFRPSRHPPIGFRISGRLLWTGLIRRRHNVRRYYTTRSDILPNTIHQTPTPPVFYYYNERILRYRAAIRIRGGRR